MVQMKVGGRPIDLMVDTGTTYLVATQYMGPLSQRHVTIVGVTGGIRLAASS
jgi:hypothetical protein